VAIQWQLGLGICFCLRSESDLISWRRLGVEEAGLTLPWWSRTTGVHCAVWASWPAYWAQLGSLLPREYFGRRALIQGEATAKSWLPSTSSGGRNTALSFRGGRNLMTENGTGLIVAAPQFHRPGQTPSALNGRGQFPPICRIGDDQGYTTGIRLWLSRKWPVTACRTDQHLISASPSPITRLSRSHA
jgi:hypothetical protein